MTAQQHECIILNGESRGMATLPLTDYLKNNKDIPKFIYPHTACWRGYLGTWEIKNDKLFLIELVCYTQLEALNEIIESDISILFPDQKEVFAKWFTGVLRIPDGKIINYTHTGFASTYEEDLFITFKNGVLINYKTVENKLELINSKKNDNGKVKLISRFKDICNILLRKLC